jgi:hypothetical protein
MDVRTVNNLPPAAQRLEPLSVGAIAGLSAGVQKLARYGIIAELIRAKRWWNVCIVLLSFR